MFSIAGTDFFGGPFMHSRCRLTPFPVTTDYNPALGQDYNDYRCINEPNYDFVDDVGLGVISPKEKSPWFKARDCFWPIDESDTRLCTLTGSGLHKCLNDPQFITNPANRRWCGSNYDGWGNFRFKNSSLR